MIPAIYRLAFIVACYAMPEWKKIEDISTLKPLTYVKDAVKLLEKKYKKLDLNRYSMHEDLYGVMEGLTLGNSYMIPNIEKTKDYIIINRGDVSSFIIIEHGMNDLLMMNELLRRVGNMIIFNNSMLVLNTDHDMPSKYINQTIEIIRRYKK